jgi:hypothetical protein
MSVGDGGGGGGGGGDGDGDDPVRAYYFNMFISTS